LSIHGPKFVTVTAEVACSSLVVPAFFFQAPKGRLKREVLGLKQITNEEGRRELLRAAQ
jgi:hypothetical protein